MKKLIVFLAVFALIGGVAMAFDVSVGGGAVATLAQGNSESDDDPTTGFDGWFWMGASAATEDGAAGAKGSFSIDMASGSFTLNTTGDSYYYGWWRPMQELFLKLGKVGEDGKFWEGAGIVGWDLNSNDLLINPKFNYYNAFAGSVLADSHGFFDNELNDRTALQLSILPIDGLAINLGFNLDGNTVKEDIIEGLAVQVAYSISGAGTAAFGFKNGGEDASKQLAVQYKQSIGNMNIEAGAKFWIDPKDAPKSPLDIGLGFGYGSPWGDTFWTNVRAGIRIGMEDGDPMIFGLDIVPSYDLGPFRVYVPVGIGMVVPEDGDSLMAWNFSPYIRKQMGGIAFWAGVLLYNGVQLGGRGDSLAGDGAWANGSVLTKDDTKQVNWAIPIAIHWEW